MVNKYHQYSSICLLHRTLAQFACPSSFTSQSAIPIQKNSLLTILDSNTNILVSETRLYVARCTALPLLTLSVDNPPPFRASPVCGCQDHHSKACRHRFHRQHHSVLGCRRQKGETRDSKKRSQVKGNDLEKLECVSM